MARVRDIRAREALLHFQHAMDSGLLIFEHDVALVQRTPQEFDEDAVDEAIVACSQGWGAGDHTATVV